MPENKKPQKNALRKIYEFSSLGFQMASIIGLSAWFGRWLDQKYHTEKSWFTLVLVLVGISVAMYFTLKKLKNLNED